MNVLNQETAWRCANDTAKFCPPEGCSEKDGCHREKSAESVLPYPRQLDTRTHVWETRPSGGRDPAVYIGGCVGRSAAKVWAGRLGLPGPYHCSPVPWSGVPSGARVEQADFPSIQVDPSIIAKT